ncbi:unnamed protein product [Brassica oleracea]
MVFQNRDVLVDIAPENNPGNLFSMVDLEPVFNFYFDFLNYNDMFLPKNESDNISFKYMRYFLRF